MAHLARSHYESYCSGHWDYLLVELLPCRKLVAPRRSSASTPPAPYPSYLSERRILLWSLDCRTTHSQGITKCAILFTVVVLLLPAQALLFETRVVSASFGTRACSNLYCFSAIGRSLSAYTSTIVRESGGRMWRTCKEWLKFHFRLYSSFVHTWVSVGTSCWWFVVPESQLSNRFITQYRVKLLVCLGVELIQIPSVNVPITTWAKNAHIRH